MRELGTSFLFPARKAIREKEGLKIAAFALLINHDLNIFNRPSIGKRGKKGVFGWGEILVQCSSYLLKSVNFCKNCSSLFKMQKL